MISKFRWNVLQRVLTSKLLLLVYCALEFVCTNPRSCVPSPPGCCVEDIFCLLPWLASPGTYSTGTTVSWELSASTKPWLMCFSEQSLLKEAPSPQEMQRRWYLVASWSLFYNLNKRSPLILELKKWVTECWRRLSFDLWALAGRWEGPRMSRAIWPRMVGATAFCCFDPWTICCHYCFPDGVRDTQDFLNSTSFLFIASSMPSNMSSMISHLHPLP